jgi:hypothetical protein
MITLLHSVFKLPLSVAFPLGFLGDLLLIYLMMRGATL